MPSSAQQVIAALRAGHDELTAFVDAREPADLTHPSAASEWDVSQVLSHLGSGAEINLAALDASLAGRPAPDQDFNKSVWARWDAMTPDERAEEFGRADRSLVERYESLVADTLAGHRPALAWLPEPVDMATYAGLRLNEVVYHSWDVRAAFDPAATLEPTAVPLVLERISVMLGFLGRPDALAGRQASLALELTAPPRSFGIELGERIAVTGTPQRPDGVLHAPAEAFLRLTIGRLAPRYTPDGVRLTGPVTLDDLRKVFPGI
jgi:uncharacterized protein (TIGR03083 family)